jgi:hypothetical protein
MYQTLKKIEIVVIAKNAPATPMTVKEKFYTVLKVAVSWKSMKAVVYAHLAPCILNMN